MPLPISADYKCVFPQTTILQMLQRRSHQDPNQDKGLLD